MIPMPTDVSTIRAKMISAGSTPLACRAMGRDAAQEKTSPTAM